MGLGEPRVDLQRLEITVDGIVVSLGRQELVTSVPRQSRAPWHMVCSEHRGAEHTHDEEAAKEAAGDQVPLPEKRVTPREATQGDQTRNLASV